MAPKLYIITIRNALKLPLQLEHCFQPEGWRWDPAPLDMISEGQELNFELVKIVSTGDAKGTGVKSSGGAQSAGPPGLTAKAGSPFPDKYIGEFRVSVCYRVVTSGPDRLLSATFSPVDGPESFRSSSIFQSSSHGIQESRLFLFEQSDNGQENEQSWEVILDAKYNSAFRANSKVTEVLVDTNVLRSHISNTNGDTCTMNGRNQDLPIWKLGSLIDYEDNSDSILSGSF